MSERSGESDSRSPARGPIIIASFQGWNDAGDSASSTTLHLCDSFGGDEVAELDPESYNDFQVYRPYVALRAGKRELQWRTTRIYRLTSAPGERDLYVVQGLEPSLRWKSFCTELLDFARSVNAAQIVCVAALLADAAHTRPIPVLMTSEDADLRREFGVLSSNYQGPTGIVGVLSHFAHEAGMPLISCWASVPHYAGGAPSPKATVALLQTLETILGIDIPLGELPEEVLAWQASVDEYAESDAEVAEYVESLEANQDTAQLPEASGDAIARDFERYLQGQDPGKPEPGTSGDAG